MSLAEVTSRVSEIRARIALLAQAPSVGTSGATGAAFASALATAASGTSVAGADAAGGTSAGGAGAAGNGTAGSGTVGSGTGGLDDAVPFAPLFKAAGARYGVDPSLLAAIARQESSFDPNAVSRAGAKGLMQLMPATARSLGVEDPFDPAQAVDGAARLLKGLLSEFGRTDLALAAYNAGPGAVHRYNGIPPYPETQEYVRRIMSDLEAP